MYCKRHDEAGTRGWQVQVPGHASEFFADSRRCPLGNGAKTAGGWSTARRSNLSPASFRKALAASRRALNRGARHDSPRS